MGKCPGIRSAETGGDAGNGRGGGEPGAPGKALRQEVDLIAAAKEKALEELRRLRDKVGGRNKLAKLLGVSRRHLGRVLRREKPMTEETRPKKLHSSVATKLRCRRVSDGGP